MSIRKTKAYRGGGKPFCRYCGKTEEELPIVSGICRDCQPGWENDNPQEKKNFDNLNREYKRQIRS